LPENHPLLVPAIRTKQIRKLILQKRLELYLLPILRVFFSALHETVLVGA
jgi:hypothetical protein